MDWQFIIVGVIIGIAAFYTGRRLFAKISATRKGSTCDVDCGCESKSKNFFAKSNRN